MWAVMKSTSAQQAVNSRAQPRRLNNVRNNLFDALVVRCKYGELK